MWFLRTYVWNKPSQTPVKPAAAPTVVVERRADGKQCLRTPDGQFEVDVPGAWVKASPGQPRSYGVTMSDHAGKFGVGIDSEPRPSPGRSSAAEFGVARFETFSKSFDHGTVLDSTISMRPGRPPFQQTVETVHKGVRTIFILAYQESEKAFVQLSVWGPPDDVETRRTIQRSLWASLREVR
ncbi:hypothetical protein [Planctomyces sp. SH-PL14]|uniref:hypothetical protein n=1 Tax=Planctomyces sp. SH-PL14 TaxID=1632864 RepID=UPI00078CB860|nr:hypothetical protein [Planctomyces sp. SH-PL14]AMV19209.1 hypothetical protein VT03_15065 [Planctomyces sp. SH-PL14]